MLLKLRSSSTSLKQGEQDRRKINPMIVGLRILTQMNNVSLGKSNIVVSKKSAYFSGKSRNQTQTSCFLNKCFLCSNMLSLDRDVYMYKGDQGFCSVECRSRQMVLDKMREIGASTRQALASYRHCETKRPPHESAPNQIHWAIIS